MRTEPFGSTALRGCSMVATTTGTVGAACTAQCVSALEGSPCGVVEDRLHVQATISWWSYAINYAAREAPPPGPNSMRPEDISSAMIAAPTPECGEFIKWTMLAATSLCRGEGAVIAPPAGEFDAIDQWRFRHIESDDECQGYASSRCHLALAFGVQSGESAAVRYVDEIPQHCPLLPYAWPCLEDPRLRPFPEGSEAHACLRNRIATMVRALNTPLPD